MTDRPIMFSAQMIHALREFRKTQTRRLAWRVAPAAQRFDDPGAGMTPGTPSLWQRVQPGDRLWVRETYAPNYFTGGQPAYRADWSPGLCDVVLAPRWTPSIHMPRRASRLTLVVKDVRRQRLQDITDADAMAEGIYHDPVKHPSLPWRAAPNAVPWTRPRDAFAWLWNQLHGPKAWTANPEVIALTVAVLPFNIDTQSLAA